MSDSRALAATVALAAGAAGCLPLGPPWIEDIVADLPPTLSAVGILDEGLVYEPPFPLWANGLDKERRIVVPDGAELGALEEDGAPSGAIDFPVGTVFSKTFADGETPIETRLLFRRADGWDYALYQWRPGGGDADLLEGNWPEVSVELSDGTSHTLPARLDCRSCHETSEERFDTPVLGASGYQLSDEIAALPFSGEVPAKAVEGRTPEETAALAYFVGNCVSCHTGGDGTNASFSLFPEDAVDETLDEETESETGAGIRVVAGDPAASALYVVVVEAREPDYGGEFEAMPPIGVTVTDPEAESVFRAWIEGL